MGSGGGRRGFVGLAVAVVAAAVACKPRLSDAEAERLVRTYNERVIEAFRTSDASVAYPVTGWDESKRLTGLVGVKRDMGITLAAELQELTLEGVEHAGEWVIVSTRERWYYRDLEIGSGKQVGADSTDRYRMRYVLRRDGERWVVDRTEFAEPPEVGRSEVPNRAPVRTLHGVDSAEQPAGGESASPAGHPAPGPGAR